MYGWMAWRRRTLGSFRLENEYEIEYEYDFSNLEDILKIIK